MMKLRKHLKLANQVSAYVYIIYIYIYIYI